MNNHPARHFFTGLLLAVLILAVVIFLPFLTPVVLAMTLAIVFGPIHRFLLRVLFNGKERSTPGALLTVFIVAIVVLVPGFFIMGKLYHEVQNMYLYLTGEAGRATVINALNATSQWFSHTFFGLYSSYSFDSLNVTAYLQGGLKWAFANLDTVFNSVTKIALGIFVTFLALFYFLRDGRELKRQLITLSPLGDADDERILKRLEQAVYSIVAGSLIIGVIQGIMTGIGFALFHVPSPVMWGTIAAVAALIPGIGTSLVLVPGILYLFFTGDMPNAIGLLIWALLAVGLIDNLLGPFLMNKGIKIHPFFVLLSVLGGISFFGVIGFILGPLILALLFALLEIYRTTRSFQ